jgi:hypothetical protein
MAILSRGKIYWYKFYFAGQLIRKSSKSTSKTVAKNTENQRRRELEQGFNNVQTRREIRIRQLRDVAEDYLGDYRLRFRGVTSAEYAIGHVVRHLGEKLLIDIDETTVLAYQTARLKEQASPKSINQEVRFLPCNQRVQRGAFDRTSPALKMLQLSHRTLSCVHEGEVYGLYISSRPAQGVSATRRRNPEPNTAQRRKVERDAVWLLGGPGTLRAFSPDARHPLFSRWRR